MEEFDLEIFEKTVVRIRDRAIKENRLIDNPSEENLRNLVEKEEGVKKTIYDSYVVESEPNSRAAMFTRNSVDTTFGEKELQLLKDCEECLSKERIISADRTVGNHNSKTVVRLIVPERFAHIVYGGSHLFIRVKEKVYVPDYQIVFFFDNAYESNKLKPLPEKDITIRLAMLDNQRIIKIIRNSNYIGEYKKGVFAAEDWVAKTKRGGLFLHCGCREDFLQSTHGEYVRTRTLFLALSANGKTTLTCKILARKGREQSWMIQDDGGTLMPDGSFHGFEAGGVFVKTEGVNPGSQREIFYGLLRPETLCEDVYVDEDSDFDFYNIERTSNGRAVILRRNVMHASTHIDVDKIDNIILITRGALIPAICKLTIEQAVALTVLGLAMESSAGDPTKAGKTRSEFFYDPFMAGDKAEHANKFFEILQGLPHIRYFLLNTGGIGEGPRYKKITLEHTMGILDSLLRGGLEDWIDSPIGFLVPTSVRTVDEIFLHPEKLYPQIVFEERVKEFNRIRSDAIKSLGDRLNPNIRHAFNS